MAYQWAQRVVTAEDLAELRDAVGDLRESLDRMSRRLDGVVDFERVCRILAAEIVTAVLEGSEDRLSILCARLDRLEARIRP
jgi:DICT domain-containing protein